MISPIIPVSLAMTGDAAALKKIIKVKLGEPVPRDAIFLKIEKEQEFSHNKDQYHQPDIPVYVTVEYAYFEVFL